MAQPALADVKEGSSAPANLPLSGVCVVECGQGVAAAFGAKLMALLGAGVIKVEPPQGDITRRRGPVFGDVPDPENSGLFLYLNADKRGVTLDLTDPQRAPDARRAAGRRRHPDSQHSAVPSAPPAGWTATRFPRAIRG